MAARFGPVYRSRAFGDAVITLLGPEANESVLFDRAKTFSSAEGWSPCWSGFSARADVARFR